MYMLKYLVGVAHVLPERINMLIFHDHFFRNDHPHLNSNRIYQDLLDLKDEELQKSLLAGPIANF